MNFNFITNRQVSGEILDFEGEKFYKISNVDEMSPFFISVVSSGDHYIFISSTGSLAAGRVRPENALFPYRSVDHIHENAENTGSKTIVRVKNDDYIKLWEPFNKHHEGLYKIQRNIYKNTIGDKIVFEEENHTLGLVFKYSWTSSEHYGFIRESEISNISDINVSLDILDGIQNILPPGAPLSALQTRSALVDAYKVNERVEKSSLALYTMYAKLSDKAEPAESLLATSVFSIDLNRKDNNILISSGQLDEFRRNKSVKEETLTKGVRGSYFVEKSLDLLKNQSKGWMIVADIDKDHRSVQSLKNDIENKSQLFTKIKDSIKSNQYDLIKLMSGADAWQVSDNEVSCIHHYKNVLFNSMRGGIFENSYKIDKADFISTVRNSNISAFSKNESFFNGLPNEFSVDEIIRWSRDLEDSDIERLSYEYLPLTFGRRHGDPSRPWNHFEIKLKDREGERLLSYQGNWRDIFQNWEALSLSYPKFLPSFIAKFVNASTIDGYNPYRITKDGIDWEFLDPQDPWSNIGYWGDHQIIYLSKFIELFKTYDKKDFKDLLNREIYSYSNIPYRLCDTENLFIDPKNTITFDNERQNIIDDRCNEIGSDGRLLMSSNNQVYYVSLFEKLIVPLLSKLSNLVIDGGIWLNTQRPEWNDANNAIVGNGLSMVTVYYIRRYINLMQEVVGLVPNLISISKEVFDWSVSIQKILADASKEIRQKTVTRQTRKAILTRLERSAESYRNKVYFQGFSHKVQVERLSIEQLLDVSLFVIDSTIKNNRRDDGLYHSYNVMSYTEDAINIDPLYPMLEGQVAVLSAGMLSQNEVINVIESLFKSEIYREDQNSFMLYPDREITRFLEKNSISEEYIKGNTVLEKMLDLGDKRIINKDCFGYIHFNSDFENSSYLKDEIEKLKSDYLGYDDSQFEDIEDIYERIFNHRYFTGRSGTMFGYEGLGCIYWHMVSKLLLAVQENYLVARDKDMDSNIVNKLSYYYYRVRQGIGFNKSPLEYGAFPADPYSHTPKQAGAQQPGMTGQVKEEIITRFSELGISVNNGEIVIRPTLLDISEFLSVSTQFSFIDLEKNPRSFLLNKGQLAFTYCQVPFIYELAEKESLTCFLKDGSKIESEQLYIPKDISEKIFSRDGSIEKIVFRIPKPNLYKKMN